jgi:hypothetical protein
MKEQLLDVVVVVGYVEHADGIPYTTSKVYRYDVEGRDIERLIEVLNNIAVEGGQMKGE